jgi:hypothetical protein
MRGQYIDEFIKRHPIAARAVTLAIDGWDAPTYGEQQLSLFHGYYGHQIRGCLKSQRESQIIPME